MQGRARTVSCKHLKHRTEPSSQCGVTSPTTSATAGKTLTAQSNTYHNPNDWEKENVLWQYLDKQRADQGKWKEAKEELQLTNPNTTYFSKNLRAAGQSCHFLLWSE
ncbi:hypothetical protein MHYP_G00276720 [Metynnis hypsauchen]